MTGDLKTHCYVIGSRPRPVADFNAFKISNMRGLLGLKLRRSSAAGSAVREKDPSRRPASYCKLSCRLSPEHRYFTPKMQCLRVAI